MFSKLYTFFSDYFNLNKIFDEISNDPIKSELAWDIIFELDN